MGKVHVHTVTLQREDLSHSWGLSLVGGSDVGAPLVITRVVPGSVSDGQVYRGDLIAKIGDYDSRDIRHEDAENLFRNSKTIRLVVERDISANILKPATEKAPSLSTSSLTLPPLSPVACLSPNPSLSGRGLLTPVSLRSPSPALSFKETIQEPVENLPYTVFSEMDENEMSLQTVDDLNASPKEKSEKEQEIEIVLNQPYRTTPLVLPGAKVKHEPAPTESYLRHHPNPAMRGGQYVDQESFMKQRVADSMLNKVIGGHAIGGKQVVHKQFNSPINLYSESNVTDTIHSHTGTAPIKKHVVFDPSRSETLKALQEEHLIDAPIQEVSTPVPSKIFSPKNQPNRVPPAKKPVSPPQVVVSNPYANAIGGDEIQQSGSFKRLMHHVLGQTDY